jgi:hypothetical protein
VKRKRKEFSVRHTTGWLKSVGPVQLVCSERKSAPAPAILQGFEPEWVY